MTEAARIENGFAEMGAGAWLASRGQPAAFFGEAVRLRRKGWMLRDRAALELVQTTALAKFADATRPFLTYIPCAAPISAVSAKVLVAPAAAWAGAELVRVVPMSARGAICTTRFSQPDNDREQSTATDSPRMQSTALDSNRLQSTAIDSNRPPAAVVMATASRTARIAVEDGDTLSVRPEAVVAWTGNRPTGFVRRLRLWDILLPRAPRDLMLHFHGPCIVWIEGSLPQLSTFNFSTFNSHPRRRTHGV